MSQYARPVTIFTNFEDDTILSQIAHMENNNDAIIYSENCKKYGADAKIFNNIVTVIYKKDKNGKIGPN